MKKKFGWILSAATAAALVLGGCGGQPTETVSGEKPQISVVQSSLYCELGSSATLPAATAVADGANADIKVTVWYGGEMVAEFSGGSAIAFTPDKAGDYVVRYQAESGYGRLSDVKEVNLTVGAVSDYRSGDPVIEVSSADEIIAAGNAVQLRAATGRTADGADVSSDVNVTVYDDGDNAVFEGDGGTVQTVDGLTCGTFTVVYTLQDGGNSAVEKKYYLAIVSGDGIRPVLKAPLGARQVMQGKSLAISTASATDKLDGDVSSAVMVRIETAEGAVIMPERSADSAFEYTFEESGDYRVIYSVKNGRGVAGDELGFAVTVLAVDSESAGITLDGIIDEAQYGEMPSYRFGMGGNANYYFYADDEYLYVAADVKDSNLVKGSSSDATTALNYSDGLEFMFDPDDTGKQYITGSNCFRVRVGVDGTTATYSATSANDQWAAGKTDMTGNVAVTYRGTVCVANQTSSDDEKAVDEDEGYTVELRLPWSAFGYDGKPCDDAAYGKDYVRMAFGHRDLKSCATKIEFRQPNNAAGGGENNCFYNGMNSVDRPKVASEGLNPSLYQSLYISGQSTGVNPVSYDKNVVLDGFMEESFWSDGVDVPFGATNQGAEVTAKAKLTVEGVYVGVYIADSRMVAEARGFLNAFGIFGNDGLDLRVVPESEYNNASLGTSVKDQPNITDGKIIAFDPLGSAYMQMMQPVGATRTHAQLPFAYGVTADGTVGYSLKNDSWTSGNIFIADKNVGDSDKGWGVEAFIPWSTLNTQSPSVGDTVRVRILLAIFDRDAAGTGSWRYGICEQGGTSRATPNMPNTYFLAEQTIR